jgi:hypothetical protein
MYKKKLKECRPKKSFKLNNGSENISKQNNLCDNSSHNGSVPFIVYLHDNFTIQWPVNTNKSKKQTRDKNKVICIKTATTAL